MDSFYDREVGVAWGPITKEEILDDLLLLNNKDIKHRNTLNCNPTFNDDKSERLLQITSKNVEFVNVNDEVVVLSSEDEIDLQQYQKEVLNDSLGDASSNSLLNYSSNICGSTPQHLDIFNRSQTPANVEDRTYDSILDIEEHKNLSEVFSTISIDNSGSKKLDKEDLVDIGENDAVILKEGPVECNVEYLSKKIDMEKNSSCELAESFSSHSYPNVDKCDVVEHAASFQEIEVEDHLYSCNSSQIHEEIAPVTEDNINDNSLLNDTLAEMERLLNEGLKCSTSAENTDAVKNSSLVLTEHETIRLSKSFEEAPRTPEFNLPTIRVHPSSEIKPTNLKFHASNYKDDSIRGAVKKPTKVTKIPVAPPHNIRTFIRPVLTPKNNRYPDATSAPTSTKKRFKNIESPISVYIKNSGVAPLYQKITPSKPLSSDKIKIEKTIKINKENTIIFPEVRYKPARMAIVTKSRDIKLPQKIESLLQQKSNVVKHEGRIGSSKVGKCGAIANKMPSKADLTLDSNAALNTTEDISIQSRFNT
ncbi:hypothetical protein QE152_g8656 [Popillia japonica]|uniref:Uncharacterized protein n=1 Tax=Popillia japonica TaxID=7064 RepID=A0AAW1LX53_POPJA